MATDAAKEALLHLRDPSNFQWYIIPILVIVMYIYSVEIKKAIKNNNWDIVASGLTVLGMDLINEIINGIIFHVTQYSALWTTPGDSVYIIMIGWNIEIAFMFSIAGLAFGNILPSDKYMKILGIPNRWFAAISMSIFAVFVELLLNAANVLIWEYPFWNASIYGVWLIFLFGYLHFFVIAAYIFDMENKNKIKTLGIIWSIGIISLIVFMGILKWI